MHFVLMSRHQKEKVDNNGFAWVWVHLYHYWIKLKETFKKYYFDVHRQLTFGANPTPDVHDSQLNLENTKMATSHSVSQS